MSKSVKVVVSVLLLSFVSSGVAFADWTNNARVERIRTYANSDRIDIWFDQNVTSGCSFNDRVSITSSYADDTRRDHVLRLATAARLSGALVTVNTLSGCVGSNGKLEYLTMKE